jgi:hypothetical protein
VRIITRRSAVSQGWSQPAAALVSRSPEPAEGEPKGTNRLGEGVVWRPYIAPDHQNFPSMVCCPYLYRISTTIQATPPCLPVWTRDMGNGCART